MVADSDACLKMGKLNPNDEISEKFYFDHICVLKNGIPRDLAGFCNDFRSNVPLNHVMMLTKNELKQLRKDLQGHQAEFHQLQAQFAPIPSLIHFYTNNKYDFVECDRRGSRPKGKRLNDYYGRYVPRAAANKYQIYHGCAPSRTRPGFHAPGTC